MLRERFSIGVFGEHVEASSEYAIDESFTLDARQDEPDNTEESKIKEEPLEDTFAPEEETTLVSEAELDEEIPEEMPEVSAIPDETPEFHGVEISPEYIAMLENLASKEEEYEDTSDDDSDFDPSRNETFLFVEKLEEDMPEEDVEENTEVSYEAYQDKALESELERIYQCFENGFVGIFLFAALLDLLSDPVNDLERNKHNDQSNNDLDSRVQSPGYYCVDSRFNIFRHNFPPETAMFALCNSTTKLYHFVYIVSIDNTTNFDKLLQSFTVN
jgi:hypothetical protein